MDAKHLYLPSGYVNMHGIINDGFPVSLVIGGRGTGKTFGALSDVLDYNTKFLFMRRTQSQIDIVSKNEFSPFRKICSVRGIEIVSESISKYNAGFYIAEEQEGGVFRGVGAPIGYSAALSTFSNIRGFDASDVTLLIYDEFIPERHERPIKNEFDALMNCYETINRNRELENKPPLKMLCMANANDLANPVFIGLNLVKKATQMQLQGKSIYQDTKRGIALYFLNDSPISDAKSQTALYKLTAGTQFASMSLGNEFASNDIGRLGSKPLKEYVPIVAVGELCIYQHKSRDEYYISTHYSGSPPTYTAGEADLARFRRTYGWVWIEYLRDSITFEDYLCQVLLAKYFK